MSKWDVSNNYCAPHYSEGANESCAFITPIASMIKINTTITELSTANNSLDAEAIEILAPALEDNGTLSKLDISHNSINEGHKAEIKQICDSKTISCER